MVGAGGTFYTCSEHKESFVVVDVPAGLIDVGIEEDKGIRVGIIYLHG